MRKRKSTGRVGERGRVGEVGKTEERFVWVESILAVD